MKKLSIIIFMFITTLFFVTLPNTTQTYAGWETDTIGDASQSYFDIINMTISKTDLQLTLAEEPYYKDSGVNNWRFYNIWIDTSMHDTNPDTETWSTDFYEYVAHFDCRRNGDHWINNSYISAFRYYLTSDGSAKVEGTFYWDGNNWVGSNPNLDVVVISGNDITFDIDGAIHREQPLGTSYIIQGVANTSNSTTVDIAPNNGWVDEFDNMCICEIPQTTGTPYSSIALIFGLAFLGMIGSSVKAYRKK